MKKITRANFEGLRQRYPVLNKEEMRRYIGGNSTLYNDSDLALLNVYTLDMDMNACSAVGSDKDDEMEEDVWSSDLGISAFSSGGYGSGGYSFYGGSGSGYDGSYGYGGYGWDIDYGYLDEVVIYGNKPNNDYYSGGNGYPGWNDDSYWGSDSYWGYGYGTVDDGNKRGDIINQPWACMFNCMNYIDPSKSASEYYKMYIASGGKDPKQGGGLLGNERNDALTACGFSFVETKSVGSGSYRYIGIIDTGNGLSHAAIITTTPNNGLVKVYDPSMPESQRNYDVHTSHFETIYKVVK